MTGRADLEASYVEYVTARRTELRRIAYALCGDWHRADDLVQTALVKLYVAWPRVSRADHPDAYVRKILVRANIDEHRRAWRRREQPTDVTPDVLSDVPDGVGETRDELFEALALLPPRQRACVVLRHWLELSVRETADALGIGEGAVKTHTSRGRERLRELLGELESARERA